MCDKKSAYKYMIITEFVSPTRLIKHYMIKRYIKMCYIKTNDVLYQKSNI